MAADGISPRPDRLSRAEIDAAYAAIQRGEPVIITPDRAMPSRPVSPGRRSQSGRYLGVLGALVLAVVISLARHGSAGAVNPDAGTGEVPARPTDCGDDRYTWMNTQPTDPDQPVGYNPCRQVPVEINYANATPDILELTQLTMAQINQASGLRLKYVGASQHYRRTQGITGRVLISFNDLSHDDSLVDAAATGGSVSYTQTPAGVTKYYVGGAITLNTEEFNHYDRHDQALVLAHEFGRVLGLDHVEGAHQVMSAGDYSVTAWGEGDLTALARLGRLPCQ